MKQKLGFIEQLFHLPLFLLVFGLASIMMLIPAGYAGVVRELVTGRAFLYSGLLGIIIFVLIAISHHGRMPGHGALGPLMSLFSTFVFLPLVLAIPFHEALQTTSFFNSYIEMVSSITTTGATLFDDPERLNRPLHLWRALVGWLGGLIMWVAASSILAPLNLGGFEITARAEPGRRALGQGQVGQSEGRLKLIKIVATLFPIYFGLTWLLWALLWVSGDESLVALCHAMSILATSGISPVGGLTGESGFTGEMLMVLFMLFALSRLTFSSDTVTSESGGISHDPEFRIGIALVVAVPTVLFLRHWLASYDVAAETTMMDAGHAFWGALFTVMSFLTTTGFASNSWGDAQQWSGLATPGLILMGLCLIGGGVATTAGGVKLLRVFALYRNGCREMERLVHPSSVSNADPMARRLQKNGAFIAWIFFMLFALSLAAVTVLLAASGASFEESVVMAIASLSTTGPLLEMGGDTPIRLIELNSFAKSVFVGSMVLGRLEILAIIALLTPDLWRG